MLETLGFDVKEIICAFINFGILVFVLTKFLYKPMVGMLDRRRETIRSSMEQAEEARVLAEETREQLKRELAEARAQSTAIVEEAARAGEEVKRQIIEDAHVQAKAMLSDAKAEIEEEKAKALVELKREVALMAAMCATKMIQGEMDEDVQQKLVGKYIGEVGRLQ